MVDAAWAPSADDPFAPPVFSGIDGGYPAFLHTRSGSNLALHIPPPPNYGKRSSYPITRRMSRSHSHTQLNRDAGYPPGILISSPSHPAANTPSASNSASSHSHSHGHSHLSSSSHPSLNSHSYTPSSLPPPHATPPSRHAHSHSAPPRTAVRSNTAPVSPTSPHPPSQHAHFALPPSTAPLPVFAPTATMSPGISAPSSPTPTAGLTDTPRPRVRMNSMPPPSAPTDYVVRPQRPQAQSHDAAIPQYVDPPRVQKPLPTALPPPVGKPWVHDPSRPNFLPPACTSQPSPLMLLHDTLDIARDYREFVDTVGRLEHEYGRALQAAVKKFEGRLDAVNTPAPGGVKPPTTTLTTGMRGHLQEMNTVASLFTKRQDTLASQLGHPLHNLDRRIGESTRRLAVWNKEIRGRWEEGRQRVDTARAKYEAAVREHSAAEVKLRQCTPPELSSTPQVGSEWIKHEKLVAELERVRSDRKKAYIVALAGEGANGGGGRDVEEGGGACGWGEEARQLYGHVQNTMLELLRHHVEEDRAHYALLGNVISRLEATYAAVDLVRDQDTFLEWNTSSSSEDEHASPRIPTPDLSDSSSSAEPQSADSSHPSLRCFSFVAPPSAQYEEAVLDASKKDDRNWLINRWLISSNELNTLTDGFSKGPAVVKRDELARARQKCLDFAANRGIGDPDEMWERRMNVLRELGVIERRVVVTKAEMACLEAVLGPNPRPEMTHDFKERAFATPSQCDACHEKVWSPIKSELSCRHCAIALHKACGLHVEPECTGLKSRRRLTSGGRLRRSLTSGAMKLRRTTIYEAPHGGPVEVRTATPAHRHREPLRDDEAIISPFFEADTEADRAAIAEALAPDRGVQLARVRASFPAGGILELSVRAGEVVRVLEPDLDGSGWAKVRRAFDAGSTDQEGLVPLYALALVGSSTAPADGGCGIFVSADFTFPPPEHTLGVGEIAISKGAIYELTRVGMAFDELWCQLLVPGPDGARVKGVVPKTYVTVLDM